MYELTRLQALRQICMVRFISEGVNCPAIRSA
jgi:hypothetical protein